MKLFVSEFERKLCNIKRLRVLCENMKFHATNKNLATCLQLIKRYDVVVFVKQITVDICNMPYLPTQAVVPKAVCFK